MALVGGTLTTLTHAQQSSVRTVVGERVTSDQLKSATAVREFTPEEFHSLLDAYTAEQCKKGTLHVTTDGHTVTFAGSSIGIEEFGPELLRRLQENEFFCVDVVGPGGDAKRLGKLMRELKDTGISISWHRQDDNEHH